MRHRRDDQAVKKRNSQRVRRSRDEPRILGRPSFAWDAYRFRSLQSNLPSSPPPLIRYHTMLARHHHLRRRGASAVEAAVTVSLLTMCVMGVIEFSRMGMMGQVIDTGAREGAR